MNNELTFVSLFSGIGGMDLGLERAGWSCVGQVELNPKAQAVLARHWPDVPKWSDVRDVGRHNLPPARLLCGGFPCQDVSIAGRRAGLAGKQSGLWFEFYRVVCEMLPPFVLIENVPGLLSSNNGRDIEMIIDALTQIGYTVDVNIKDSQEFGVPQRRRRVFLVCVRLDDLLSKRTSLSKQISADLAVQQLLDIWGAIPQVSSLVQLRSIYEKPIEQCLVSLNKRTSLLSVTLERLVSNKLQNIWDVLLAQFGDAEQDSAFGSIVNSELPEKQLRQQDILKSLWMKATSADGHSSISTWLNNLLDVDYSQENKSITSISIKPITDSTIFTFATASLSIIAHMLRSLDWSVDCLNVAQSASMLLQENMNYARQAIDTMFITPELRDNWWHYFSTASDFKNELDLCCSVGRAAEVLFERESLPRDTAPRRQTGQGAARSAASGVGRTGEIIGTLGAEMGRNRGLGNANETDLIVLQNIAKTLTQNYGKQPDSSNSSTPGNFVIKQGQVRRLTPTECERLQSFPDGWTDGQSDSERYRQLGLAVTVSVAEWIGRRIEKAAYKAASSEV